MLNLRIMSLAFFHFISFVMKERFQRKYSVKVKESLIVWTEIYHPYPWSDLVSENVQTNSSSDLNNIFPPNNTLTHTFHYKWALVQSLPSCTKSILSQRQKILSSCLYFVPSSLKSLQIDVTVSFIVHIILVVLSNIFISLSILHIKVECQNVNYRIESHSSHRKCLTFLSNVCLILDH